MMAQHVGFHGNRVHPWDSLVTQIWDDLIDEDRQNLVQIYRESVDGIDDFDTDSVFRNRIATHNDLDSASVLCACLKRLNLHGDSGSIEWAARVQKYIIDLENYCRSYEVIPNKVFVGRQVDLESILDVFISETSSSTGVCICGLGGQGKSCLATQICWTLHEEHNWSVVKVDLRNKKRTEDVWKSVLSKVGAHTPEEANLPKLLNLLKTFICEKTNDDNDDKMLLCLDDCDHTLGNHYEKHAFMNTLGELLKFFKEHKRTKVRLLMTTRDKLLQCGDHLNESLEERVLKPLDEEDGIKLLNTCSTMDIEYDIATEIVRKCACSPLAITIVSELLKNGIYSPERLAVHLNIDKNVTKGVGIHKIIQEAVNCLKEPPRVALICLTVFQSSPFDMKSAQKVIGLKNSRECTSLLQALHESHLLEVEVEPSGKGRTENRAEKYLYSLHPLVHQYLTEWKMTRDLQNHHKCAIQRFVDYYEGVISKLVKKMHTSYWKGRKILEKHKIHITQFYKIMADEAHYLKTHSKSFKRKTFLEKKFVSDLADILLSDVMKRRMFESEAKRALKVGNNAAYIFWMVEEADLFVMLHDQPDLAGKILDGITNGKYPSLRGLHGDPFYEPIVHALFHKVKGLVRWKQLKFDEGLNHLNLSLSFYEHYRDFGTEYNMLVCQVKSYIAQVNIDIGNLDVADQCLHEGLNKIKAMIEPPSQSCHDDLATELHWDIPSYYLHWAEIHIAKAKSTSDPDIRAQLFEKATKELHRGRSLDEKLKLDYLDNYYSKVKLLADILIEKGLLDEAKKNAEFVLDRRRGILQPPHFKYTESVYQVARIWMLLGNRFNEKGEKFNASEHWIAASDTFLELTDHHLRDGSVPLSHPLYKQIKTDHLTTVQLAGENDRIRKIQKFYKDLENGAYDSVAKSRVKAVREMMWTPMEMLMKLFSKGGREGSGGSEEFGAADQQLQGLENLTEEQRDNFVEGFGGMPSRHDSGHGHSSSDLGDSFSSGSGSMSARIQRMHIEKSVSLEDNVFETSNEVPTLPERKKPPLKRSRTNKSEDGN
ncbi:uncharacterized protein LOC128243403 isoform X1 [Mya arenaria]|uniref:uncharacterized protein LOC128243403 isoform X1 n=1 Tax=Mya arenaria TaxID=6604 RepID=UPI0022E65C5C|nr:uncharacterized protein LOC128243403 isoform X1 [Mya arenaria]